MFFLWKITMKSFWARTHPVVEVDQMDAEPRVAQEPLDQQPLDFGGILEIRREQDGAVRGTDSAQQRIEIAEGAMASMNFWLFGPDFLKRLEEAFIQFMKTAPDPLKSECYIPSVVDELIQTGQTQCPVLRTSSEWFGVTYPDDKPHVVASIHALIEAGEYPTPLA